MYIVYHDRGYLWGRSKFHFSNYRIQVYFWTFISLQIVLLFNVWTYRVDMYEFLYPQMFLIYCILLILSSILLIVDWYYLCKVASLTSIIDVIPLITNIAFWGGYSVSILLDLPYFYYIGLFFIFTDFLICTYTLKTYDRLHLSYSGLIEVFISVMRCLFMMKATRIIDYYWTMVLFPLTCFSVFASSLFIALLIQIMLRKIELMINWFNSDENRITNSQNIGPLGGNFPSFLFFLNLTFIVNGANRFLFRSLLALLSFGPPLLTIIFHLERFDKFGSNRFRIALSVVYMLVVAGFLGYRGLVRIKINRRSKFFRHYFWKKLQDYKIRKSRSEVQSTVGTNVSDLTM